MYGQVYGTVYGGTTSAIGYLSEGNLSWQPPTLLPGIYATQYATPVSYTRVYASPLQMALKELSETSWDEADPADAGSWEE